VFKSKTVLGHIARGIAGFAFLAIVLGYGPELGWWTLIPAAGALAFLRGCPMCWTVGLVETVLHRRSDRSCGI
jgi:hypothetical protein